MKESEITTEVDICVSEKSLVKELVVDEVSEE